MSCYSPQYIELILGVGRTISLKILEYKKHTMERYFYEEDLGMEVAIEVIIRNLREMLRFSSEMVR